MRRALLTLALALVAPAPAAASGGGLFPAYGGSGATTADAPWTYVTVPAGRGHSVVQAIHKPDGAVQLFRRLTGEYATPTVALDGSQTGLSGDGATLVLVENSHRYPPRRTKLLVLYAMGLQTRAHVTLPGYSSVDAVSPDGRWIYLVHYRRPQREDRRSLLRGLYPR